ncbi:hypothetical protein DDZ18_13175 [Marinicauda salina]|uniref:YgjP-like metallopeptidase domain-containing protein n=1 Tax=Marinicauda salina TaxID=2135793 RepID=A0A2U2BQV1_9PROT|nr:SprT family zinc-dependent metalloprotease [Marinicauda salina]PWE16369.1 hypothetical protein DDZ18_13175 [Marinicauda salina]
MTARAIRLDGREVAYTLKRSARRRTIGLKVGPEGLVVTLPGRAGEREAERVIRDKSRWVLKTLEKWADRPAPQPLKGVEGEIIPRLGRGLDLRIEPHAKARTLIDHDDQAVTVSVDERLDGDLRAATVRRALERWRRRDAEAVIPPKVIAWADRLGLPEPVVKLRAQKARWGSCSSDGVIRMNVRLMAFEDALIDYVCAHEACHLVEMNHGPRFHALMDRLMPDHRARRRALAAAAPAGAHF